MTDPPPPNRSRSRPSKLTPNMASEESSLRALESLMTEFFHSCTTNERKREIEELLNNFAQQMGAWRHCLYFLSNTRNEYVMMYSLTVFENLVNKMWLGVASQDKMEIRSCLPKLLLAQHKALPFFIRNKLCKVIVDIGRQDWPMFYHDFFTNTLQLIQSPTMASLGLVLLKTTSEEMACPREDLSVARKDELRKLLLEQVPTVLGLLTGILETIWDKHSVTAATPPPSPTSGESGENVGYKSGGTFHSRKLFTPFTDLIRLYRLCYCFHPPSHLRSTRGSEQWGRRGDNCAKCVCEGCMTMCVYLRGGAGLGEIMLTRPLICPRPPSL
ncbi:unnamed protein product [Oncorhynchus mykiss]|uniref:Importin N-terminal domain-containing protein n=1 Tax=Oncorhynchus mykiss TaxID=8022 RepID=A0A060WHM4_ONCMY|nr:unnamed protein product [Oncorhynchus mykiss]